MQTKTIDSIVREALMDRGFPIHYYLPFLHHALRCSEELARDFNLGKNVKELRFTVNSYNRIVLPSDVADVVNVFGLVGGERKEYSLNESLTLDYKLDGVTKKPWLEADTTLPDFHNSSSSALLEQTSAVEYPTVFYPDDNVDYEYNVDLTNSEVVFGPRMNATEVYVRYVSKFVSTSVANTIHPYANPVIHAYIDWKHESANGTAQSRIMEKESRYKNERRLFRAAMNPLTVGQLYNILVTN